MFKNFLRVGLIVSGQVFGERVIKERRTITGGPSGKADLVFPVGSDVATPSCHELFRLKADGQYVLQVTADMTGRFADGAPEAVAEDITALVKRANRQDGFYQLPLTDKARGKVVIGLTTVLFQFVPLAPQVEAKPPGLVSRLKNAVLG